MLARRPCIAPRPDVTLGAIYGSGGSRLRPGAVSLANGGMLILDDLPAFGRRLAPLPAILDERRVTVERAGSVTELPAVFQLVATMRPCPCGWFGDPERACCCSPALVARHQRRVPDALRGRIDLHVEVPRVSYERLTSGRLGEPSAAVRERVVAARRRQAERFADSPRCRTNGDMEPAEIRAYCELDGAGQSLMKAAVRQLDLSAAGYHRVLRLARTIADLAHADRIGPAHLAKSIQYRGRLTH